MGKIVKPDFIDRKSVVGEHWYDELRKEYQCDEREFAAQERANKVFAGFCLVICMACIIAIVALIV